jgi:hypothetical protein
VLENLGRGVGDDDSDPKRVEVVLPFMGAERRDVVSDGPLVILGCEGCPTRQERRGKGSGNEKSSTESHGLLLFL